MSQRSPLPASMFSVPYPCHSFSFPHTKLYLLKRNAPGFLDFFLIFLITEIKMPFLSNYHLLASWCGAHLFSPALMNSFCVSLFRATVEFPTMVQTSHCPGRGHCITALWSSLNHKIIEHPELEGCTKIIEFNSYLLHGQDHSKTKAYVCEQYSLVLYVLGTPVLGCQRFHKCHFHLPTKALSQTKPQHSEELYQPLVHHC